jgi:hypothetical protein
MADPTPDPDTWGRRGAGPDDASRTGMPRWVKVFGIILAVVVLLLVAVLLLGGGPLGDHGPGRHTRAGDASEQAPPLAVAADSGRLSGPTGLSADHR